jgi:4-hydroxy-tetrahydrodipicolinate synthase
VPAVSSAGHEYEGIPTMTALTLNVRTATTFSRNGDLDEDALRRYLQRFVDNGHSIYLASAGSGEGSTLTWDEMRRVYRAGVETGKGKIPVYSNQPDRHTARDSIDLARLAIEAGVDMVNIYGPASFHGYRATDEEYLRYFDRVLAEIKHPVALAPNPSTGYSPPGWVIAAISDKHHQVAAVNLSGLNDAYYIALKDALKRPVDIYAPFVGAFNVLPMGAAGLLSAEANLVPRTFRQFLDLYTAGKITEARKVYGDIRRLGRFTDQWKSSSPRVHKMAMKVLRLPGWEGGVRLPYLLPSPEEQERFAAGLIALDIPEISEQAATAS